MTMDFSIIMKKNSIKDKINLRIEIFNYLTIHHYILYQELYF